MAAKIFTFNLPDIGEGVVEGEVIEWLKKVGDSVHKDEPVVVVMTDKATVELPAPFAGVISKHYYKPGEISHRDKPLYDITLEGEVVESVEAIPEKIEKKEATKPSKTKSIKKPLECNEKREMLAKPKVRHLAKELGIDLSAITPSGPHGDITLQDLGQINDKKTVSVQTLSLEGDEELPLIGIQGLMARKMDGIHIPQFSYFEPIDATRLVQLRENSKALAAKEGVALSFMPFFIKALALVIKSFPQINSSIDLERGVVIHHRQINVGVAMATPLGLIVPVLKGVEKMSFREIVHAYDSLKIRAQQGKLTNQDMHGATITISNYGAVGEGRWATPMVMPPEVAILALARIVKTPVVRNDAIVIRDILNLSWSFDHRLIDGEQAAKVSKEFTKFIKDPSGLIHS